MLESEPQKKTDKTDSPTGLEPIGEGDTADSIAKHENEIAALIPQLNDGRRPGLFLRAHRSLIKLNNMSPDDYEAYIGRIAEELRDEVAQKAGQAKGLAANAEAFEDPVLFPAKEPIKDEIVSGRRGKLLKFVVIVLCVVVLLGALYLFGRYSRSERAKTEKQQRINQAVAAMVKRNNAVQDWMALNDFPKTFFYTLEAQDAISRIAGRPILLKGTFYDVARKNEEYLLSVGVVDSPLEFEIECGPSIMNKMIENERIPSQVALIVSVSSLHKSNTSGDEGSEDSFIARGSCLDGLPLPAPSPHN